MKLQQLHVSSWVDMTAETRAAILGILSTLDPRAEITSIALRVPMPTPMPPLPQVRITLDVADVIALLSDR